MSPPPVNPNAPRPVPQNVPVGEVAAPPPPVANAKAKPDALAQPEVQKASHIPVSVSAGVGAAQQKQVDRLLGRVAQDLKQLDAIGGDAGQCIAVIEHAAADSKTFAPGVSGYLSALAEHVRSAMTKAPQQVAEEGQKLRKQVAAEPALLSLHAVADHVALRASQNEAVTQLPTHALDAAVTQAALANAKNPDEVRGALGAIARVTDPALRSELTHALAANTDAASNITIAFGAGEGLLSKEVQAHLLRAVARSNEPALLTLPFDALTKLTPADQHRVINALSNPFPEVRVPIVRAYEKLCETPEFQQGSVLTRSAKLLAAATGATKTQVLQFAQSQIPREKLSLEATGKQLLKDPVYEHVDSYLVGPTPLHVTDSAYPNKPTTERLCDVIGAIRPEVRRLITSFVLTAKEIRDNGMVVDMRFVEETGALIITRTATNGKADDLASMIVHESGHALSIHFWGKDEDTGEGWAAWKKAAAEDGLAVSGYAAADPGEDFGDTYELYEEARARGMTQAFITQYPHRAKLIDELLARAKEEAK